MGSPPGSNARGPSSLRLVWVYPDLLSTYGDRGNLLVLARRAKLRGVAVEPVLVNANQPVPRQGDIYLMGGGEDLPQILAARRLRDDGGLAAAAKQGGVVFAVCAGYQLLGSEFGGEDGQPLPGLGILDIRSSRGERRGVGEILADVDPKLGLPPLTGFENHQGVTRLGPGVAPLAQVTVGVGNGDGTEGAFAGRVLGTYLHGPVLVRNPALADLLLSWAVGPLPPLPAADEEWARRLRDQRLAVVSAQRQATAAQQQPAGGKHHPASGQQQPASGQPNPASGQPKTRSGQRHAAGGQRHAADGQRPAASGQVARGTGGSRHGSRGVSTPAPGRRRA